MNNETEQRERQRLPVLNSIPQTMRQVPVSRAYIYRLIDEGLLIRVNIGRRAFITGESIEAYVRELSAGGS